MKLDILELECEVDRLSASCVLDTLGQIFTMKATHITDNWQDDKLARLWVSLAHLTRRAAEYAQSKKL